MRYFANRIDKYIDTGMGKNIIALSSLTAGDDVKLKLRMTNQFLAAGIIFSSRGRQSYELKLKSDDLCIAAHANKKKKKKS